MNMVDDVHNIIKCIYSHYTLCIFGEKYKHIRAYIRLCTGTSYPHYKYCTDRFLLYFTLTKKKRKMYQIFYYCVCNKKIYSSFWKIQILFNCRHVEDLVHFFWVYNSWAYNLWSNRIRSIYCRVVRFSCITDIESMCSRPDKIASNCEDFRLAVVMVKIHEFHDKVDCIASIRVAWIYVRYMIRLPMRNYTGFGAN